MKTKVLIRLATQAIRKNKMRATLTMLGIIIGVAAVIVMVAVGYGARTRIRQQIDNLGTNMIVITPGAAQQAGVSQGSQAFPNLSLKDVDQIRNAIFKVVGVLSMKGQTASGNDSDDVVLIPYTTASQTLSGRTFIPQILASTANEQDIPAAQDEIRTLLIESHKGEDFTVKN